MAASGIRWCYRDGQRTKIFGQLILAILHEVDDFAMFRFSDCYLVDLPFCFAALRASCGNGKPTRISSTLIFSFLALCYLKFFSGLVFNKLAYYLCTAFAICACIKSDRKTRCSMYHMSAFTVFACLRVLWVVSPRKPILLIHPCSGLDRQGPYVIDYAQVFFYIVFPCETWPTMDISQA